MIKIKKNKIREKVLEQRNNLALKQIQNKSKIIQDKILSEKRIIEKEIFHIYYPINNEVSTLQIIKYLLKKNKTVVMPRSNFKTKKMKNYIVNNIDNLEKRKYGLMEPKKSNKIFDSKFDVIFIPGVVFDIKKDRIGYGEGFYDRFLKKYNCLKIGLAYDFQVIQNVPVHDHDERLTEIVTNKRVIR